MIRGWQLAFVVGAGALVLSGLLTFGISQVTAVIGLLVVLTTALNALTAPPTERSSHNIVLFILRRALNQSVYLYLLTVAIWVGAVIVSAAGVREKIRAHQLVDISGVVLTPEGEPAAAAVITLVQPATGMALSNAQGAFRLSGVNTNSNTVALDVQWRQYATRLSGQSPRAEAVVLALTASHLTLRTFYFNLTVDDMREVVRGRVRDNMASILGGQPFIIPTAPLDVARAVLTAPEIDLSKYERYGLSARVAASILRDGDWRYATDGPSPSLWQPLQLAPDAVPWLRSFIPPDFAVRRLAADLCGGTRLFSVDPESRRPYLKVLTIENTTKTAVQIGAFELTERGGSTLRGRTTDAAVLPNPTVTSKKLFPAGVLQPNESLLLPMQLYFELGSGREQDQIEQKQLISTVQTTTGPRIAIKFDELVKILVDKELALAMLRRAETSPVIKEYLFGPTVELEALEVNGIRYRIRDSGPEVYVMKAGMRLPKTSCPIVYSRTNRSSVWIREVPILVGRHSKELEAEDVIPLTRFDGSVLIQEEESEVTWLDSVYVRVKAGSRWEQLVPKQVALRARDGHYVRLGPGDRVEVNFDWLRKADTEAEIVVRGYYVPIAPKK